MITLGKLQKLHGIFFVTVFAIISSIVLLNNTDAFHDFIWVDEPVHTFVEVVGAIFAIIMAIVIRYSNQKNLLNKNVYFSFGFLSMGIFNIFHSVTLPGNSFVFLHSIAALFGGFFFSFILFPKINKIRLTTKHFVWLFVISVFIGIISLAFPEILPPMTSNGEFTNTAIIINVIAGFLFLLTSIRLTIDLYKSPNIEIFLFLLLAFLFAMTGFTFHKSMIWDGNWWLWHLLQLFAFIITFTIVIKDYLYHTNKLKEQQIAIVEKNNALMLKNKELSHFTYIASHDLQEPLNTVLGFAGFLKEDYYEVLDDEGKKYLDIIDTTIIRMRELVIDLLEYSRIGKQKQLELVNVNKILDEIKSDLSKSIKENKVQILSEDLLEIKAFKLELRMLLLNLITNAIKYRKESESPIIEIKVEENPSEYIYTVIDNGIGIDMKYKDKIFEVFQRLHTKDQYSGNGIGLSNCYRIVELHEGKIWVNSEKNVGSKFSFTISKGLKDE